MKLRRLLPGSVTGSGGIVDYAGLVWFIGPCWVPVGLGVRSSLTRRMARGHTAYDAGWRVIGPLHPDYPGLPPRQGLICVAQAVRS